MRFGNNFDKSFKIIGLAHPFRFFTDPDLFPFEIEQVNDPIFIGMRKDLGDELWAIKRMVVFIAKRMMSRATDDEFFQVLCVIEKGEEYFSNFLSIPLNFTQIHRPPSAERWNFSQLLEHGPEFIHLHFVLADTDA